MSYEPEEILIKANAVMAHPQRCHALSQRDGAMCHLAAVMAVLGFDGPVTSLAESGITP